MSGPSEPKKDTTRERSRKGFCLMGLGFQAGAEMALELY
jgi:hypothetical protein